MAVDISSADLLRQVLITCGTNEIVVSPRRQAYEIRQRHVC